MTQRKITKQEFTFRLAILLIGMFGFYIVLQLQETLDAAINNNAHILGTLSAISILFVAQKTLSKKYTFMAYLAILAGSYWLYTISAQALVGVAGFLLVLYYFRL